MDNTNLSLRKSTISDLEIFFLNQLDSEAGHMAAFTAKDPTDKEAYMTKYTDIINSDTAIMDTIIANEQIAGSIGCYEMGGETHITYWLGKEFWGQGIATKALTLLISTINHRPLYGSAAWDNIASQRVMQKCGFKFDRRDKGFANARGKEIEEVIFILTE